MLGRKNETDVQSETYEGVRYEYLARNLKKVPGMALEDDFNKHGQKGWRFVAVAQDYAIFIREQS
jgi:hypothetical protein